MAWYQSSAYGTWSWLTTGPVIRDFDQDVWSANGWVQASWDFLDDFTLEGGVRVHSRRRWRSEERARRAEGDAVVAALEPGFPSALVLLLLLAAACGCL